LSVSGAVLLGLYPHAFFLEVIETVVELATETEVNR